MTDPKRKLTFDLGKGLGKLKIRAADGGFTLEPTKKRSLYTLQPAQAEEMAQWLGVWSAKLTEREAEKAKRHEQHVVVSADGPAAEPSADLAPVRVADLESDGRPIDESPVVEGGAHESTASNEPS